MAPLTKRKYAKARQGKRRNHLGIAMPTLNLCPQCNSPKISYQICPNCGSYGGRTVIEIKAPKQKKKE